MTRLAAFNHSTPARCNPMLQLPDYRSGCGWELGMGTKAASPDAGNPQSIPPELILARQVLETVPSLIYVFDVKDEKNIYQNRRLGDLLGNTDDDGLRGPSEWQRYIHPDDSVRWPAQLARLRANRPGETLSWECRVQAKNGEGRWFSTRD